MPKVKIHRKSPIIDMTAMCDVAFLLLTFFMLTSNFTRKEATAINTPTSISEIKMPERNIMLILVDPQGKVFFGIDGQDNRIALLNKMASSRNLTFDQNELKEFSLINSFGIPIDRMRTFLALSPEERNDPAISAGIPCDSTDNQFRYWVEAARSINPDYKIAIKADQSTPYPVIKKLMNTLQDLKENRYNLITSLESAEDLEIKP